MIRAFRIRLVIHMRHFNNLLLTCIYLAYLHFVPSYLTGIIKKCINEKGIRFSQQILF